MKNMTNIHFLNIISFSHTYSDVLSREYEKKGGGAEYERKIRVVEHEVRVGHIIGRSYKYDGVYTPGRTFTTMDSMYPEHDPPAFTGTKRFEFWRAVCGMNIIVLVPTEASLAELREMDRVSQEEGRD